MGVAPRLLPSWLGPLRRMGMRQWLGLGMGRVGPNRPARRLLWRLLRRLREREWRRQPCGSVPEPIPFLRSPDGYLHGLRWLPPSLQTVAALNRAAVRRPPLSRGPSSQAGGGPGRSAATSPKYGLAKCGGETLSLTSRRGLLWRPP